MTGSDALKVLGYQPAGFVNLSLLTDGAQLTMAGRSMKKRNAKLCVTTALALRKLAVE